jgi:hypothetical protein
MEGLYEIQTSLAAAIEAEAGRNVPKPTDVSATPVPVIFPDYVKDVRICGIIKRRCHVTKLPLVRVYLELSVRPPLGWSYVFMTLWQADKNPKPNIGLDEDSLWIECVPASLKHEHLPRLQEVISATNSKYKSTAEDQQTSRELHERLGREALEMIQNLDLELRPRPEPVRRSRRLQAYWSPFSLALVCVLLLVGGRASYANLYAKLGIVWFLPLVILWSWVVFAVAGSAFTRFRRIFRIRQWAFRRRKKVVWPERYVDREGRAGS